MSDQNKDQPAAAPSTTSAAAERSAPAVNPSAQPLADSLQQKILELMKGPFAGLVRPFDKND